MAYQRGETYILSVEVKDSSGEYYDPDTSVIAKIIDANNNIVSSGSMVKDSTGKYHYDYTIKSDDATGIWQTKVICVDGTRTTIETKKFLVESGSLCSGVIDAKIGSATIIANDTSVTVTHGYGETPTVVIVTPTNEYGLDFYVSDKGSTTFKINLQVPQSSNATFDWLCK